MNKEIKLNKNGALPFEDYITVGDKVNGKDIEEIWVSRTGAVLFAVNGIHYKLNELIDLLTEKEVA